MMLPTMTSWELLNRIHSTLGERHKDAQYEGIITGADDDTYVGMLVYYFVVFERRQPRVPNDSAVLQQ